MDNEEEMVSIPLDLTEKEIAMIAMAAHQQNVTINDFMVSACEIVAKEVIETHEREENPEENPEENTKADFFDDVYTISSLLNHAIETALEMPELEFTTDERRWVSKALDDSFSVLEIATRLNRDNT